MLEYFPKRFGGISSLRHHFHIRFVLQQTPQSLAQQDMIVYKQATNFLIAKNFFALDLCGGAHRATPSWWPEKFGDAAQVRFEPRQKGRCLIVTARAAVCLVQIQFLVRFL
jgi:hypothetical protein